MRRCFDLAKLGEGNVAPNPMVGAVLVFNELVIGEGYHRAFGQAHAEVNCINSVAKEHEHLIDQSILYVSLEPCSHFGKTPPCTNLILEKKIPKVVIACRDPFLQVNGNGIEQLKAAGIEVITPLLEKEALELNKRFFTFHTQHRPYIILKWAQTANGKIAAGNSDRLPISNEYTNRLVHKWRSEEQAILVGTQTIIDDNPKLDARDWAGNNPVRIVLDQNNRIPKDRHIYDNRVKTIIFSQLANANNEENTTFEVIDFKQNLAQQILKELHKHQIQSVIIEGGRQTLQTFIDENLWDEARIFVGNVSLENGTKAPNIALEKIEKHPIGNDELIISRNHD